MHKKIYFSSIYITGTKTKLSIFFNCVLKRRKQKGIERSKKIHALKYGNSFQKNKFVILNNFADTKDLSKQSLSLVILYLSIQKILLDKELKLRLYFF